MIWPNQVIYPYLIDDLAAYLKSTITVVTREIISIPMAIIELCISYRYRYLAYVSRRQRQMLVELHPSGGAGN
jgi:hypothetical protein